MSETTNQINYKKLRTIKYAIGIPVVVSKNIKISQHKKLQCAFSSSLSAVKMNSRATVW